MDFFENVFFPIIVAVLIGIFLVHCDNETTKEKAIIEKTKEFTIYQHCKLFDGEWYCYD